MIMLVWCMAAIFIDMMAAWYQWKKKDICGVIFSCTLALIAAIGTI